MRPGFRFILMTGMMVILSSSLFAQSSPQGSTRPRKKSPALAAWMSAVVPGAGQVYNGKNWWWKVPLIYGAGGTFFYSVYFYQNNYNDFRNAYKYRIETGAAINNNERFDKFQTPTLKAIRDSYRQARDEAALGLIIVYTLQILDASVEAHLLEFDINDDLSLKIQPVTWPQMQMASAGIQLNLVIK